LSTHDRQVAPEGFNNVNEQLGLLLRSVRDATQDLLQDLTYNRTSAEDTTRLINSFDKSLVKRPKVRRVLQIVSFLPHALNKQSASLQCLLGHLGYLKSESIKSSAIFAESLCLLHAHVFAATTSNQHLCLGGIRLTLHSVQRVKFGCTGKGMKTRFICIAVYQRCLKQL